MRFFFTTHFIFSKKNYNVVAWALVDTTSCLEFTFASKLHESVIYPTSSSSSIWRNGEIAVDMIAMIVIQ